MTEPIHEKDSRFLLRSQASASDGNFFQARYQSVAKNRESGHVFIEDSND